jgi:predicted  nucleic acid-binding Zn ribbon protein
MTIYEDAVTLSTPNRLSDLFSSDSEEAAEFAYNYHVLYTDLVNFIKSLLRYGEVIVPVHLMPYFSDLIGQDLPTVRWTETASYGNSLQIKML